MSALDILCDSKDTYLDHLAGEIWTKVAIEMNLPDTIASRRAALWAVVGPNRSIVLRGCCQVPYVQSEAVAV
jgi:hypothetical protein